ncbi:MAG: PQQ-dependent sugar dehydrogenase [Alphaproteobacteria bacterium]|nr:PQQ-dependent sugar dehydrogenase [Alphaproteobacteria bacterium]
MRLIAALALVLVACKKSDGDTQIDSDDTDIQQADFGYDERPANPSCVAPGERLVEDAAIDVNRVFNSVSLNSPVGLYQAPGDADHWYVIEQDGRVKRFDGTEASPAAEVVLDITGPVASGGEMGLLGLAFHPDFQTNGKVFLSYTANGPVSHIASVQTSNGGADWDAASLETILTVSQPYSNHNGGNIAFGLDGMLYIGFGDGGSAGDPENRAQNLGTLLGKILRIDVDTPPYVVPPDNPFVGVAGAREEIFAYGLRNPWRFSIDSSTGELWAGDVGQNAIEEVDRIQSGGNYGWRLKEGNDCYATNPCDAGGVIDPVVQYRQNSAYGGRSVMGGVVYRGSAIPSLVGTYLFTDYYHGKITAIVYDPTTGEPGRTVLLDTGHTIVHFAEGNDGEVYYLTHDTGRIFRIDPLDGGAEPDFPTTLSATGCVDPANPQRVASGVIPYDINHPFWSDHAAKRRWLALPDGTQMTLAADGDLEFPVGTVLMKEFTVNGQLTETRLFMRHADEWGGYTYKWRADGSDADLLRSSEVVDASGVDWEIPSRAACMQCHTAAAGRSLGIELGQLDRTAIYPATNREAPQIDTLVHIGMLAEPPAVTPFPAVDDAAASVEERARTYLHVNCSQCHRPGGPGQGDLDMRLTTALADTNLCGVPQNGDLGIADPRIVAPGDPASSVLLARTRDLGAYRMPPIASHVVDDVGTGVLSEWIAGLTACP